MYTVVNRIFYALLLDHHAGGASLSLRAVADRHHLKCHFVFDPVMGRAENHAGAFEHMDALLGDLESDVHWTDIDNGQQGFVVSVPVYGHR